MDKKSQGRFFTGTYRNEKDRSDNPKSGVVVYRNPHRPGLTTDTLGRFGFSLVLFVVCPVGAILFDLLQPGLKVFRLMVSGKHILDNPFGIDQKQRGNGCNLIIGSG